MRRKNPTTSTSSGSSSSEETDAVDKQEQDSLQRKRLEAQFKLEREAEKRGAYVKKQRVKYFHKGSDQWFDHAMVVDVHLDDGPDKPYYVSIETPASKEW